MVLHFLRENIANNRDVANMKQHMLIMLILFLHDTCSYNYWFGGDISQNKL